MVMMSRGLRMTDPSLFPPVTMSPSLCPVSAFFTPPNVVPRASELCPSLGFEDNALHRGSTLTGVNWC